MNLVTFGTFNSQRCLTNLPAPNYVVPREDLALSVVQALENSRTVLVHSYLGNGKTIFLSILSYYLSTNGYKVFNCNSANSDMSREIELIKSTENPIILFDSYDVAINGIPTLREAAPNAKFIVAVRTGNEDVRFHEIQDLLPAPIQRISINKISRNDKNTFKALLSNAGVLKANLAEKIDRGTDFRDIVTTVYDHEVIREKIAVAVAPLFDDPDTSSVLISCLLLSLIGADYDPALLRLLSGSDPYVQLRKHEEISAEIFRLDDERLEVRSPVFVEYLIDKHCSDEDIIEIAEKIAIIAVQRKQIRGYGTILSRLLRISTLRKLLSGPNKLDDIANLFDRLKRDIDVNREPLFWLQYAILSDERGQSSLAESFLETAYDRANESLNFRTYQIDTYALRLLLKIEEQSELEDVTRFEKIMEKSELVLSMLNDDSHRLHAIRVLEGFEPFVKSRAVKLTTTERNALVYQINRLVTALTTFPAEVRAETGSDSVNRKLESAIRIVVSL